MLQHNRHILPAYCWLCAADSTKINLYAHYRQKVHKKFYEEPMTTTFLQVAMEPKKRA